jgi:hypothetical protein
MGGQIIESRERIGKVREGTTNMQGRERMTKRAVSAIRKTGTAAAIEKCRKSSNLINAHLVKATSERFVDASANGGGSAFLERAAAVLKNTWRGLASMSEVS